MVEVADAVVMVMDMNVAMAQEYRIKAQNLLYFAGEQIADREESHPDPGAELKAIGQLWGDLLGIGPIPPEKVALMLICMKVVRAWEKPNHYDNWVDIAGYGAIGGAHTVISGASGHEGQQVP